jgi:hypothetical protein
MIEENSIDIITKIKNNEPAMRLVNEILELFETKLNKKMTLEEMIAIPKDAYYNIVKRAPITEEERHIMRRKRNELRYKETLLANRKEKEKLNGSQQRMREVMEKVQ